MNCSDLFDRYPEQFARCCTSCHHDWDDGYGEPLERSVGDETLYYCCAHYQDGTAKRWEDDLLAARGVSERGVL